MTHPILASIQVGLPQTMGAANAADPMDKEWTSGVFKRPVNRRIWVSPTGLEGDGQADLKHHGGPEKAVLAYAATHYTRWRQELGLAQVQNGGFGENFTIAGQTEEDVCIGDVYAVGETLVQVSQPRRPCWKLERRHRLPGLVREVVMTGRTGWYFRVLREGWVIAGELLMLRERAYPEWTVATCNDVMRDPKNERSRRSRLADCPLLSASWREKLSKIS